MLVRKCSSQGIAISEVPADGDCMAWSLRTLYLGIQNVGGFGTKDAQKEVLLIRSMMASAWEMVRGEALWQDLFDAFCADRLRQNEPVPQTPKKKRQRDIPEGDNENLETPPRPDGPDASGRHKGNPGNVGCGGKSLIEETGKPEGPKRAEGAQPVPLAANALNTSQQLMQPQPKCARKLQEPEVPDLEEAFHQIMMKPPEEGGVPGLSDANVEDIDEDMLKDYVRNRKRKAHERCGRTKAPTQRELNHRRMNSWLAQKGLTYQVFSTFHRQKAAFSRAAACETGGWKTFKEILLGETKKEIKCDLCKLIIQRWKVPAGEIEIQAALDAEAAKEAEKEKQKQKSKEDADDHAGDAGNQDPDEQEDDQGLTEYQKCVKVVQSYAPIIELIETPAGGLMYRCRVCITRTQPQGKTNKLPVIKVNSVKALLVQHVDAPSHKTNADKLESAADNGAAASQKCPGYCVNHHPDHRLFLYLPELKLWLSYNNLDSDLTQHDYWHVYAGDLLWIRHKDCHGHFLVDKEGKRKCCQACESLTDRKSVQKTLVRFLMKFYAAVLLQKRLFCNESEVKSFLEQVEEGTFASNNGDTWKKIQTLRNMNLQAYVRKAWNHITDDQKTPNIKIFLATVVDPCLKVHVNTELAAVNAKIAEAAVSGRLDRNPFVQGLLVQLLIRLEKEERGVSTLRGRHRATSETEIRLMEDAALNLAIIGGNKAVCVELGQKKRKPKISMEDLPGLGLPNPALALMNDEQLENNFLLIDQLFPRRESSRSRRLIMGMDGTYLLRSACQFKIKDTVGLVGGAWSPVDSSQAFADLNVNVKSLEKAPTMLEFVLWDPCGWTKSTYSVASMPMALSAPKLDEKETQAPSNHATMPLEMRAENAMSGLVLLDVFQMLSNQEAARRGLPRGSLFLANETVRNLQHAAMGVLSVTLSKSTEGSPWSRGEHRLSELPIEMHFGRLRTQSPSAQLTAKSYWTACARDMMRSSRQPKPASHSRPPPEDEKPLSADEFFVASERAYRSSIRFAAYCAGSTMDSLDEMYREWCNQHGFDKEGPLLGDEFDMDLDVPLEKAKSASTFLEGIRTDAAMEEELPDPVPGDEVPKDFELKNVPDSEMLQDLFSAKPEQQVSEEDRVPPESPSKGACSGGLGKTLHHSLWCLGQTSSDAEIFDSIWRLVMYLRHWHKGCDRTWISDPRTCRKKSSGLNWYQLLGSSML
eukprot:s3146_g4.t1